MSKVGIDRREVPKTSWLLAGLVVRPSMIQGVGLFTSLPIAADAKVIIWGGKVFTKADVAAGKGRQHTLVGISEDLLLGNHSDDPPGLDDYMNHSCDPNIGMSNEITLVAMRDIEAGEELVADYAIWLNNENYIMGRDCRCGSQKCRRVISGKDWQKPDVQNVNRGYFSPFIARRIAEDLS